MEQTTKAFLPIWTVPLWLTSLGLVVVLVVVILVTLVPVLVVVTVLCIAALVIIIVVAPKVRLSVFELVQSIRSEHTGRRSKLPVQEQAFLEVDLRIADSGHNSLGRRGRVGC
jgi:hypothetical protein